MLCSHYRPLCTILILLLGSDLSVWKVSLTACVPYLSSMRTHLSREMPVITTSISWEIVSLHYSISVNSNLFVFMSHQICQIRTWLRTACESGSGFVWKGFLCPHKPTMAENPICIVSICEICSHMCAEMYCTHIFYNIGEQNTLLAQ